MTVYKSNGKSGFSVSVNLSQESLAAAGLTAAIAAVMLLIVKGRPHKKAGSKSSGKEAKKRKPKSKEKDKKSKPKSESKKKSKFGWAVKTLILPIIFRLAKSAVTQGKLQGILKKVKAGEDIGINANADAPAGEEAVQEDKPVTVCGLEIIEPINVGGEDEIYEHLR